jgi:hypothetical protein
LYKTGVMYVGIERLFGSLQAEAIAVCAIARWMVV